MNNLTVFKNKNFGEVRTTLIDDKPYFCLADVCRILEIRNVSDCKKRLKSKGVVITDTLTEGGMQSMIFINEANLYKCIFQSRKPEAERFQDWVTEEVIPEIRKTGGYSHIPKSYSEALRLYADEVERREVAEKEMHKAIREKSWIGSHREATAMATASAKVREANKLKIELDLEMSYATVKKVEIATGRKYNWQNLKKYCQSTGLCWNKVFDANYGVVNSYPAEAWKNVYGVDL